MTDTSGSAAREQCRRGQRCSFLSIFKDKSNFFLFFFWIRKKKVFSIDFVFAKINEIDLNTFFPPKKTENIQCR